MKITRHGFSANHGYFHIDLAGFAVRWDSGKHSLIIKKKGVGDFNSAATHNYDIAVNAVESNEMLVTFLNAIESESGQVVIDALKPNLLELQR